MSDLIQFEDLSDDAKKRAREDYRANCLDYEWWDFIYEDFVKVVEILGVEIDTYTIRSVSGKDMKRPRIWFSLHVQGAGACFEGHYSYSKGWRKKMMAYNPNDTEIMRIGEELQRLQKDVYWKASTWIRNLNCSHSNCMRFDMDLGEGIHAFNPAKLDPDQIEEDIGECLRDLANWLYGRLDDEYDHLTSDEAIDESIIANEWEFTEDGEWAA